MDKQCLYCSTPFVPYPCVISILSEVGLQAMAIANFFYRKLSRGLFYVAYISDSPLFACGFIFLSLRPPTQWILGNFSRADNNTRYSFGSCKENSMGAVNILSFVCWQWRSLIIKYYLVKDKKMSLGSYLPFSNFHFPMTIA